MCIRDRVYTANHAYYREQVDKGGFRELDMDFIQTYLPQTYGVLPESAWEETHINGKIYMVPRNTASIFPDRGPVIDMDVAAVSYTHLDVYKRQSERFSGAELYAVPGSRIHHCRHSGFG